MDILRRSSTWAALIAVLAVLALAAPATAQSSTGTIEGTVTDESGAVLPGVMVTAKNTNTGFERIVITDAGGRYRVSGLPPGSYEVSYTLEGFNTVVYENVRVNVGRTDELDPSLQIASVEESITVTTEAPLINRTPALGTVVSTQELEQLPLNGRQFASLGSLAPGTTLGVNPDPTKVGKLVIGLNGGSGRNVNFVVDGGDNTDDTIGGQLQNFSLESVAEFNIKTQQYKAEYGRTTGGVLTVVTKTGGNEVGGSVFGFFRDDALNARSETQKQAGVDKPPFERQQYGFSLGGPFVRDQAHWFVTGERLDQDSPYTVITNGLFPNLDGASVPLPTEDSLITGKVTWNASPKQYLQVRYGYQETSTRYGAAPNILPDALGDLTNEFQTVLVGYNHIVSPEALNEAVLQWSTFENLIVPVTGDPTVYYPSGVVSGQNPNSPQSTTQEKLQLKDDFSYSTRLGGARHDFKAGLEYIDESDLGGFFAPGTAGQYTRIEDRRDSPISQILFFGGDFAFSTPNEQYRFYVQDDWSVSQRLTVNLGLRYEYTDILELDQTSNPIWQRLATQTTYDEYYLRDFQGGRGGKLEASDDDFAPRVGFAYDLKGTGDHIVRGGWGLYYDFPYSNATVLFPAAAVLSDFGLNYIFTDTNGIRNPDGSFFQPGDPLPPNSLPGGAVFPPNEVASPTLSTPYSTQASLGYSWQATPWLGVNVDLVSVRYKHLPFRFRANPIDPATGQRRFPEFGNFRLWYGNGEAQYDGINLNLQGRLQDRFYFQGFYTYSEAEGNVLAGADEFRVNAPGHQPDMGGARRDVSVNPLDPLCGACFGPLNTDSRHRLTLSGAYTAPWDLLISGVFRYRSALPYTVHTGLDLNGDGFPLDLPAGVTHVNSARGGSFSQFDLRLSREFVLASDISLEVIAEVFNLFDDDNPAGFVGNQLAGNFGQPTSFAGDPGQGEQRLGQIGLRLRF